MPINTPPTEALTDFFTAEIGPYSVAEWTVGAFGVALAIGGLRWAYGKALGKK